MNNEILHFINEFSGARETFLFGCCYYFAVILRERFGAEIYYDPKENHFVGQINGRFYDASGEVTGDYINWKTYSDYDELDYKRVVRDCIIKE